MACALRPSEDIAAPLFMLVKGNSFPLTKYKRDFLVGEGASALVAVYVRVGTSLHAPDRVALKFSRNLAELAREAGILSRLSHPHVMTECGQAELDMSDSQQIGCSVLEYCGGGSLEDALGRHGPMPSCVVTMIGVQLLLGVDHQHANCVIHRDLKPANFLFDSDSYVKICDYGLSKYVGPPLLTHETLADGGAGASSGPASGGSIMFMAPERLRMLLVRFASDRFPAEPAVSPYAADMWALGVSLFELITGGVMPFDEERFGVDNDKALSDAKAFWSSDDPPSLDIYRRLTEMSTPATLMARMRRFCVEPLDSGLAELVVELLHVNPAARLTASAALLRPFLSRFIRALLSRQVTPARHGSCPPGKQTKAYAALGAELLLKGKKTPSADLAFRVLSVQIRRVIDSDARIRPPSAVESASLLSAYDAQVAAVRMVEAGVTERLLRRRQQRSEQGPQARGAEAATKAARRISNATEARFIASAHQAGIKRSSVAQKPVASAPNAATVEKKAPASGIVVDAIATSDESAASQATDAAAALFVPGNTLDAARRDAAPASLEAGHGPVFVSSCAGIDVEGLTAEAEALSLHRGAQHKYAENIVAAASFPDLSGTVRLNRGLAATPMRSPVAPASSVSKPLPLITTPLKPLPFPEEASGALVTTLAKVWCSSNVIFHRHLAFFCCCRQVCRLPRHLSERITHHKPPVFFQATS